MNFLSKNIKRITTSLAFVLIALLTPISVFAADIESGTEYWGPKIFKWHRTTDNQFGVSVLWEGSNWVAGSSIDGTYNTYSNNNDAYNAWGEISHDCEIDHNCIVAFPAYEESTYYNGDVYCTVFYGQGEVCGTSTTEVIHVPVEAGTEKNSVSKIVTALGIVSVAFFLLSLKTKNLFIFDK